jgi:hypothetical protein
MRQHPFVEQFVDRLDARRRRAVLYQRLFSRFAALQR